jgi:hypothetical protein
MSKVVFVDTSATAKGGKRRRKPHICYDGEKTFKVDALTKLKDYDKIFIDTLFPEIYDEVMELLRKGVEIYCLKDTIILKRLRKENNLRKSDAVDTIILSRIPMEKFRPLIIEELEFKMRMRPLIRKYERIMRWKATLKKLMKDGFNYNFKESIRLMKADGKKTPKDIIGQVTSLPIYGEVYRRTCEILKIKRSAESAILTLELPLHLRLVRLKGLLGLIPGKNEGKYHHKLRWHFRNLAANLYINAKRGVNVSDKVTEIVDCLPKRQRNSSKRLQATSCRSRGW